MDLSRYDWQTRKNKTGHYIYFITLLRRSGRLRRSDGDCNGEKNNHISDIVIKTLLDR